MANAKIVNTPSQAVPQDATAHTQRTISSSAVSVINWTLSTYTTHSRRTYWTAQMASRAKAIRANAADVTAEIQELNFL
jgi:hypothetical protein